MSKGRTFIPQIVASILLAVALYPENPYAYYVLLRWILCPLFIFLAIRAHVLKKEPWVWILGVCALLYNPLFRVHLNREIWSVVNVITIFVCTLSMRYASSVNSRPNA
jgi:hypothetical protein